MGLIERWTIYPCPRFPAEHGWGTGRGHCPWCNERLEAVEVVPASQLRGAVEDRERYRKTLERIGRVHGPWGPVVADALGCSVDDLKPKRGQ